MSFTGFVIAQIIIPEQTSSLSAGQYHQENNRFFISSSQPLLLMTEPPSLIVSLPTSVSSSIASTLKIKPTSTTTLKIVLETAQKITEQSLNSATMTQQISEKESVNLLSQITVEEEEKEPVPENDVTTSKAAEIEGEDDTSTTMTSSSIKDSSEPSSSTLKSVNSDVSITEPTQDDTINVIVPETIDQTTNASTLEAGTTQKTPKHSSGPSELGKQDISASKTVSSEIKPTALPVISSSSSIKESFLAPKVSRLSGASRPEDLPRVAPSNSASKLAEHSRINLSDDSSKVKKNRQSDEQSQLPGMNDIITGKHILFSYICTY